MGTLAQVEKASLTTEFQFLSDLPLSSAIKAKFFDDRSINKFSLLPNEKKETILNQLNGYRTLLSSAAALNKLDDKSLLKMALKKLKLSAPDDLFDLIKEGDIIEIYSKEGIQHYRNMEFIKLCSYTLLEMLTEEWWKLFERPDYVTKEIIEFIQNHVFTQDKTVECPIPSHILKERHLKNRKAFLMNVRYLAPP